jgi:glycosyltransferase involved in cell wall biosynthesis
MTSERKRIVILSRYCLVDQYDLAAEYPGMLKKLCRNHDVMHLSLKGTSRPRDIPEQLQVEELPLRINRSSQWDILIKSMLFYFCVPFFASRIRKFRPHAIFIPEALPLFALFAQWTTSARVAMAFGDRHLHNRFGNTWWIRPLLRVAEFLEAYELSHIGGVFSRTQAAEERIHSYGVPRKRIQIVYDVAHTSDYYPRDMSALRHSLGFADDDIVLFYHGIMHKGKGLEMLLDWVGELHRDHPRIKLIMVGSGPELGALKQRASRLDLGCDVYFTGWLKTVREVGDYCNAADICIAMRKGDTSNDIVIPGALIHCMACRKVVMAPRLSAISEVIRHGENGFMFTPNDGQDFRRLVLELAAHRADWETFAERAYQDTQQRFSLEAAEKGYAEAIASYAED